MATAIQLPADQQGGLRTSAAGDRAWPRWLGAASAVVVVAALARFAGLSRQSFWYDEAVSVELARSPLGQILSGQAKDLGNPPLYPVLLHLWMRLFGTGDAAVRALSALLGTLTVPLVYQVGRRLLPGRVALGGALLFAVAPYQLQLAQEARGFTLLTFLGVAAVAALLWALRDPPRWGPWCLLGGLLGAMCLTHYFGLFMALALAVYLALAHARDLRALLRGALAFLIAGGAFAWWLPSLIEQLQVRGNLTRSAHSWHLHLAATPLVFGVGSTLAWKDETALWRIALAALAVGAFGGLLALGAWRTRAQPRWSLLLVWLAIPIALPALVSVLSGPLYNARYVILASVPFYLFVAAGAAALPVGVRAPALGIVGLAMALSQATYALQPVKQQWREAVAAIEPALAADDLLLFEIDHNETAWAHYARGPQARLRLLPAPAGAPRGRLFAAAAAGAPATDVTEVVRARRRVWVVLSDATAEAEAEVLGFFGGWVGAPPVVFRGIAAYRFDRPDSASGP